MPRERKYLRTETAAAVGTTPGQENNQTNHDIVGKILSPIKPNYRDPAVAQPMSELNPAELKFLFAYSHPSSPTYHNVKNSAEASGLSLFGVKVLQEFYPDLWTREFQDLHQMEDIYETSMGNVQELLKIDGIVTRVDAEGNTYETVDPKLIQIKSDATFSALAALKPDTWGKAKQAQAGAGSADIKINIVTVNEDKSYKIGHKLTEEAVVHEN
jgi:hypothetical protein